MAPRQLAPGRGRGMARVALPRAPRRRRERGPPREPRPGGAGRGVRGARRARHSGGRLPRARRGARNTARDGARAFAGEARARDRPRRSGSGELAAGAIVDPGKGAASMMGRETSLVPLTRALNRGGRVIERAGIPIVKLDRETLLAEARSRTRLEDFGDDTFREP